MIDEPEREWQLGDLPKISGNMFELEFVLQMIVSNLW